VDITEVEMEH